jgi:hypothetical protein
VLRSILRGCLWLERGGQHLNAHLCHNQVGLQKKDSKFPVNADLLYSSVLMIAAPHGIMTVSNELWGIQGVFKKKDQTIAIKNLLLIVQHFKHCSPSALLAVHRSQHFFHYWNASCNALSVMAHSSLIAFSWISSVTNPTNSLRTCSVQRM